MSTDQEQITQLPDLYRISTEDGRFYVDEESGKRAPSVTSILGMGPDWLGKWQRKQMVRGIWEALGMRASPMREKHLRQAGEDYLDLMQTQFTTIGTILHLCAEHNIEPPDMGDKKLNKMVQNALASYRKYLEECQPQKIVTEHRLIGTGPNGLYAGTLDDVSRMPSKAKGVVELKTSRFIVKSHPMQAAAYFRLWNQNHPEEQITEAFVLRVSKYEVDYEFRQVDIEAALAAFDNRHADYNVDTWDLFHGGYGISEI